VETKLRTIQSSVNSSSDSIPLYNKEGKDLHVSVNRDRALKMEDIGFILIKDNKAYKVK
jgi:hypothetical protein